MEIITKEQALARAYEIAERIPVTRVDTITLPAFMQDLKTYFPEFEGFACLFDIYFNSEPTRDFYSETEDGRFVFDIDKTAENRTEIYANEYSIRGNAVLDDLFELQMFGATPPGNRDELHKVCHDVSYIWTSFHMKWFREFAKIKTGQPSNIMENARGAGVDSSIRTYMSGVPVEYLLHTPRIQYSPVARGPEW